MVQQWVNNGEEWDDHGIHHLVMTNLAMGFRWPIEIDGLPFLKMGGSSMAMLNNQMVHGIYMGFTWDLHGVYMGFEWHFMAANGILTGFDGDE